MSTVSRRTVLGTAATASVAACCAGALGACSAPEGPTPGQPQPTGPAQVPAADVPVGGGVIASGYVVSQPTSGEFRAWVATCTHQGCPVSQIQGEDAVCVCHGSHFRLSDGSVAQGPAPSPLPEAKVTAANGTLTISRS